jgi:glycosyltransferase involved in cell wall biosynthesis
MKYKVLFIHNKYAVHSGEEAMLGRIMRLLRERGHEVRLYSRDSAELTGIGHKLTAFFSGIYSLSAQRQIRRIVSEFQPDIVQIQNLFPLISPSILPVLKELGLPVVMRLANYRLICPNGLFLSHGKLCEKCRGGREFQCMIENCEQDVLKSTAYALRSWVARKLRLYRDNVAHYYAQTIFQREMLIEEGYSEDQIDVIPNMVRITEMEPDSIPGGFVGYVGRMSAEKGIDTFLAAATRCSDISFKVAGNPQGYISSERVPPNVEILGQLDGVQLAIFYQKCRFIVMPSRCYEGFPGVIIEAMNFGRPVIASRLGGMAEIVDDQINGLLFEAGNATDLAAKISIL